jgi:hypothetical protein
MPYPLQVFNLPMTALGVTGKASVTFDLRRRRQFPCWVSAAHTSVDGPFEPPDRENLPRLYRSFPGQTEREAVYVIEVDAYLLGLGRSAKRGTVDPKAGRIVWPQNGGG